MMKQNKTIFNLLLSFVLVALVVLGRLVPHLPNFTPVAATAIFAGFIFKNRLIALFIPLLGMLISDMFFIGIYDFRIMFLVYTGLVSPILLKDILYLNFRLSFLPEKPAKWVSKILKLSLASSTASIFFFVVSNLGVWAFSGMYSYSFQGFTNCYMMAIPFFRYTLMGDFFYTFAIFGVYELCSVNLTEKRISGQKSIVPAI